MKSKFLNKFSPPFCAIIVLCFFSQADIFAGEFYVGVRTWQADWTPGIIQAIKKQADIENIYSYAQGQNSFTLNRFATTTVSGLYGGPLVSYITDNKKWSFSLVGMRGNSGQQGITQMTTLTSTATTNTPTMYIDHLTDLKSKPVRNDLDFTAGYALTGILKVFSGYKYQSYSYNMDISSQGTTTGVSSGNVFHFNTFGTGSNTLSNKYGGPVLGLALGIPLSETGALSLSAGVFVAEGQSKFNNFFYDTNGPNTIPSLSIFNYSDNNSKIKMRGVTYEMTYTSKATESFFLQFGYRGQMSSLDIGGTIENRQFSYFNGATQIAVHPLPERKSNDRFHGFSLSVIYNI